MDGSRQRERRVQKHAPGYMPARARFKGEPAEDAARLVEQYRLMLALDEARDGGERATDARNGLDSSWKGRTGSWSQRRL